MRTFSQLLATIVINEVLPREKKYNCRYLSNVVATLAKLEYHKVIARKRVRDILDGSA